MKLLKEVKTYENLQKLMAELASVNLSLSGDTTGDLVTLLEETSPNFSAPLIIYLKENNIESKDAAVSLLTELEKQLEEVKTVELTLAFEPNEEAAEALYSWATENVSPNVVLDYKKNPSIMSGALVSYEGKYGDFSGAKQLKEAFVDFKEEMAL